MNHTVSLSHRLGSQKGGHCDMLRRKWLADIQVRLIWEIHYLCSVRQPWPDHTAAAFPSVLYVLGCFGWSNSKVVRFDIKWENQSRRLDNLTLHNVTVLLYLTMFKFHQLGEQYPYIFSTNVYASDHEVSKQQANLHLLGYGLFYFMAFHTHPEISTHQQRAKACWK